MLVGVHCAPLSHVMRNSFSFVFQRSGFFLNNICCMKLICSTIVEVLFSKLKCFYVLRGPCISVNHSESSKFCVTDISLSMMYPGFVVIEVGFCLSNNLQEICPCLLCCV